MRTLFAAMFFVVSATQGFAAVPATNARTINTLAGFPKESLREGINRKLFRSLEVSPVAAWIVARTALQNGHSGGAKIVHSEANGVYDKMLLEMANQYNVSGVNTLESRMQTDTLMVHLLIFKIADGVMAVCFAHNDDARYVGYKQTGPAWVGIEKNGTWTTISRKK